MTKLKVYIDFEAITGPFNKILKINHSIPYAFSIGIIVGNKFKTKTHVINFNSINKSDIDFHIKKEIIKAIKKITNNQKLIINHNTIEFLAFNNQLEKEIIDRLFNNMSVKDIAKKHSISLERVTDKEFGHKEYFFEFRKQVRVHFSDNFYNKRGFENDGALAAIAGFLLFANANNINNKYTFNVNSTLLVKELIAYSKDDVMRMKIITDNYHVFDSRVKEWKQFVKTKNKYRKEARVNKVVQTFLHDHQFSSIADIDQHLNQRNETIDKKLKEKIVFKK